MEGQELPGSASLTAAAAAALAGRLLQEALALEEVQARAAAVGALEWESPAGRNFRHYLADRSSALGSSADLIRRAARLAELHAGEIDAARASAAALQPAESQGGAFPDTEPAPAAEAAWDRR